MHVQVVVAVLYGAAALAAGATGWYVMSRRARSPLTRPMLTILGGIAEWSLTAAATALSADLAWKTAWDAAVYLGVGTTVIGFLWYSAVFAGYAWPKGRWVWTALAAEPVMAATACATNGLHHLFYSSVSQLPSGVYAVTIGPLLWAHAGYSFALCALAVGMVVRSSFRSVAAHRRLSWLLLGGATVPLLANFGSFLAASVIDATPIGFLVAAGVFLTAERRGSKLRLVPLAAQQVLAALTDAVVVIDDSGRVLDANPAARQLLKALAPSVAEHPVGLLWPDVAGPHLGSALSGALAGRAGIKVAGRATGPRPFRSSVIHAADQAFDVRVLPIEAGKQQAMGHVIVVRDVTEMERLRTVLAEQALKDGLTGAYNRRYLMQALGPAAEHARARGEPLCAVMIDLDHFKEVNDTYGHRVGDEILCGVASCIMERMGGDDVLARFGGEEFVALLPGSGIDQAKALAECWRQTCLEVKVQAGEAWVGVTISAGVAQLPATGSGESIVALADEALYCAKAEGRNRVIEWSPRSEPLNLSLASRVFAEKATVAPDAGLRSGKD